MYSDMHEESHNNLIAGNP